MLSSLVFQKDLVIYLKIGIDLKNDSSKPYIFATISLPKFKLRRSLDEEIEIVKSLFLSEVEKIHRFKEKDTSNNIIDSHEDDFFEILKSQHTTKTNVTIDRNNLSAVCTMQLLKYLDDKSKDLKSLYNYDIILEIFKTYNTILHC